MGCTRRKLFKALVDSLVDWTKASFCNLLVKKTSRSDFCSRRLCPVCVFICEQGRGLSVTCLVGKLIIKRLVYLKNGFLLQGC